MITDTDLATSAFGKRLASRLTKGAIIALYGDLGAGKTTLAKGIIEALTQTPEHAISSPTFSYVHSYEGRRVTVHHFDLYRMKNADSFIEMGFRDYFDGESICVVEWPERIEAFLPKGAQAIHLTHLEQGKRRIDVRQS